MCFLLQLSSLPDLVPALTAAEQRAAASLKWRTHEKLLQKYACLPQVISSDQIYYRFLQRMFTIMMTNVSPMPLIWFFLELAHILELTKFSTFLKSNRKLCSRPSAWRGVVTFASSLGSPFQPSWRGLHRGGCQHTGFKLDTVLQGETGRSLNCTVTSALMCTLHVSWPHLRVFLKPLNISLLSLSFTL